MNLFIPVIPRGAGQRADGVRQVPVEVESVAEDERSG
jgi:hypothetical protein